MKLLLISLLLAAASFGGSVKYSYDDAGRLVKVDYGSGGSIVYTYDNAGNLTSRTTVAAPAAAPTNKKKAPASQQKPAPAKKS